MGDRVVLFLCVENACRSLMAEAMFNRAPPTGWRAESAGTLPARGPNPRVAPMLREIGLTAPAHAPRAVTPEMLSNAGLRVTMGCLDDASCPARLHTLPVEDWALPDPARASDEEFRRIRDEIGVRVTQLARSLAARGDG